MKCKLYLLSYNLPVIAVFLLTSQFADKSSYEIVDLASYQPEETAEEKDDDDFSRVCA